MEIKLYSYWRSSASWRVRSVLEWKGLDYTVIPVNLVKGEQTSPEHLARHPLGFVPVLDLNGDLIIESTAIIELLEELYPQEPLLPTDPLLKAKVRAIVNLIACDIHPVQNLRILKRVPDREEWAKHFNEQGMRALEALVGDNFCVGDTLTLADIYLLPQVYNAYRFQVDMSLFPKVDKIYQKLLLIEKLNKAHPSKQIDAQ